ncbi:hypothetical protein DXG03_002594 [Asterophora parasitica]|uniref:Uncharacterized protein n=1 Tax=Asterophora parasitica TaxID=117018 RepID=A0A9P7K8L0_9AGAR|nr:hypothetical protein DXG03_002594 [Asterophora parasitica]
MVFGLFSRKREPVTDETSSPHLRTPSPSVEPGTQASPTREPPATPSPPPETSKSTDLHALIQSIPPPTLHAYALSHLHPSSSALHPETLTHLSAFFAQLVPPPRLHCVRCHKDFFEVENTDRSCLVAHDDESAEVERVSAKAKGKSTLYETLWGCCGKSVEGDGDMGPPDGWCYEGKHTTDPKRARFRADSTMQDDKLTSCARLHCHEPPRSTRKMRKRGRPVEHDGDGDEGEDDDDEGNQSATSSSHPSLLSASPRSSNGAKRRRTGTVKKSQPQVDDGHDDRMDVDVPLPAPTSTAQPPTSPKPKPKSRAKPKFPTPTTAKMYTTPKTSSPLVLAPPFVSHHASPEPPNSARVVINMKRKSAPVSTSAPGPSSSVPGPAEKEDTALKSTMKEPQPKPKTSPTTSPKFPSASAAPLTTSATTSPKTSPKIQPRASASAASLKQRSSAPPLKSKPSAGAVSAPAAVGGGGTTITPVVKSGGTGTGAMEPSASSGRVRKNSSVSSKSRSKSKQQAGVDGEGREGKKTKGLGEVVDSRVDAERPGAQ